MEKSPDPRIAALVGEAIKLMAEGGASAEALGHVAVNFPAVVAARLEPLPPPQPQLDIETIVRVTVDQVLGRGLSGANGANSSEEEAAQTRGGRGIARIKKNVTVHGKKTSIKVPEMLYRQLEEQAGQETDRLLQEYAAEAPEGFPNRSAWVERQMTHYLVLAEVQPAIQGRH